MKLPQLTLRELFLLVALVAMGCGWWMDRLHQQRQVQDLSDSVRRLEETAIRRHWDGVWLPPPGSVVRDGFQVDAF